MISCRGTFLKFYIDESKHHLNVPSPAPTSKQGRHGRQASVPPPRNIKVQSDAISQHKRPTPLELKLNLNKLGKPSPQNLAMSKFRPEGKGVAEETQNKISARAGHFMSTMAGDGTQSGIQSSYVPTPNHQQAMAMNPIDYDKLPGMQSTFIDLKSDGQWGGATENKTTSGGMGDTSGLGHQISHFQTNQALNLDISITQRDLQNQSRKDAAADRDENLYSMRQFSKYERENTLDFNRITQQLSQIYKKRNQKKYDFSNYFDVNNFRDSSGRYEMNDLVEKLQKEHKKQYIERKKIKQCSDLLKEIRKKRGLDQGFHSLVRNQKKFNESLMNDYQDANVFGSFEQARKSVDPALYDPNMSQIDFKSRNEQAGRTHSYLNENCQSNQYFLKTRSDINKVFQPALFNLNKLKQQDTELSQEKDPQPCPSEDASPPAEVRMPVIDSVKNFNKIRESHLRKSMSIISDAESHLRMIRKQRNPCVMSHDFDAIRSKRILQPLEVSEEDREILGIQSPMPKIDEKESNGKLAMAEDDFMTQYLMYQSPNSCDVVGREERLYSQDLLKSIYEAFPHSNIPVINLDTYLVDKALEEGRSTQMTVGSTWVNLEYENNSKNTYIKNKMTTKRLQKNIQLISKQSSKVAQQRLMKSVNDVSLKNRNMSLQANQDNQMYFNQLNMSSDHTSKHARKVLDDNNKLPSKKPTGDIIGSALTLAAAAQTQQQPGVPMAHHQNAFKSKNFSVFQQQQQQYSRMQLLEDKKRSSMIQKVMPQGAAYGREQECNDGVGVGVAQRKLVQLNLQQDKETASKSQGVLEEMSPAQYRAKQVEMMNPFLTFYNQMQTKNKSHARQLLQKMSAKDKFDALMSEQEAALDNEVVKYIALFEFDDLAAQKYGVFKAEERQQSLAQQIVQQRVLKRQMEQMRVQSNQKTSRGSKTDGKLSQHSRMLASRRMRLSKNMMSPQPSDGGVNRSAVLSRQSVCRDSNQKASTNANEPAKAENSKVEMEQMLSDDEPVSISASQSHKRRKSVRRPTSMQTNDQYDLMSHNSLQSYSKAEATQMQMTAMNTESARSVFIQQIETQLPSGPEVKADQPVSIFSLSCIMKIYPIIRMVKMQEFHKQANGEDNEVEVSFDFDKRIFVDQIEFFVLKSIQAFNEKDKEKLVQNMIYIAYLGLFKEEYQVVLKVYNLLAHTFMVWKNFGEAYKYFKKLRDTAKMGEDIETSMYAFKQIGHCLLNMHEREKALKAFKCQLQVAWHLNHYIGEISSYENIAITYFYLGKLEKSRYYLDRFFKGKTEAMFSAVKKISMGFTRRRYQRITIQPFKSDEIQPAKKGGKKGEQRLSKNTKELFSRNVRNYSLLSEEILRNLGFLSKKKKKQDQQMTDATGQYIEPGSPISNVSMRNLPSPSEVKGQSHILLMPFYQEIMADDCEKVEGERRPKANTNGNVSERQKKVAKSEEEAGIDLNTDFQHLKHKIDKNGNVIRKFAVSRDELLVTVKQDETKVSHFGPMNAIRVKQQERQRHESHVNQIRQEQYDKICRKKRQAQRALHGISEEAGESSQNMKAKQQSVDMEALRARASAHSQNGPCPHLYLSHLSPNRQNKYMKEIEDSHYEQVKHSYNEFLAQVRQEKLRVFVPYQVYQQHLKDQSPFTNMPDNLNQQYYFIEEILEKL